MDQKEILDFLLLKLSRQGLDQYDIYLTRRKSLIIEIKDGKVDFLDNSQGMGLALRALKAGSLGFAYCTEADANSLEEAVAQAATAALHTTSDPHLSFPQGGEKLPILAGLYDQEFSKVEQSEKEERARTLEASALSQDSRIKKVRKASYSETEYEVAVVNSQGIDASHRGTIFASWVMALAQEGDDSQMGYDFDFSRDYRSLDVEQVAASAARNALRLLHARKVSTRKVPVLLENRVAADFLGVLGSSFLADSVQKGKSRLQDKLGQEIFSPLVNIVDDGLYPGGISTSPSDGEGVAHRRNGLVKAGRLNGFLYDSYCANKEKRSSTGNGVRADFKSPPRVGVTNFYLEKGEASVEDLIKEMKDGLWVTDVLGMHTADPISLDFSVGCAGFVISGGEMAHPFKGAAISGNMLDVFKNISRLGKDLRFFGQVGAPSVIISEMSVGGE